MFHELKKINERPEPYQFYTAAELWTDPHSSQQMLLYHLNEKVDVASRNKTFIDKSVQWIVSHFNVAAKTAIADFGCGPGLYTNRLAKYGAQVTGIDFSQNSIAYAQKVANEHGIEVQYINQNYLDFETEDRFDLITMIMCDFCALSPAQRKKMLTKFHSLLNPNGHVLLDLYSLKSFEQKEEAVFYEFNQLNGFWSAQDYYCFVNNFKYKKEKVTLDKYTIIEKSRQRVVYNWLQYYSKEMITEEIEQNGFKIAEIYSDVAGKIFSPDSLELAIVAKKS
jgi:2-polyprenyl-3-methyl-5-hydroxy-6-metoxy-1,4-benzoquinol methylase